MVVKGLWSQARRARGQEAAPFRAGERGAAALEFALIAPVLLLLLLGIIEFGFMFQAQLALTHAAREGARMAAVGKYDAATVLDRAYPVTATITTIPDPPSAAVSGQPITITLTHQYDWRVLPFSGTVALRGTATMRRE
jgi:Flp pilus assembly pilin Flp